MNDCVMTRLGECSYEETGCSDCRVISICKEALEKQIPIKAEYHEPDFDVRMFSWWTCGNCDCEIASVVDKYCSYCGRRIDWNEV